MMANTSWYLDHYRSDLIKTLSDSGQQVVCVAPIDSATSNLRKYALVLPWKIARLYDKNPIHFLKSTLRALLLIRAVKPKLVHSYTLKCNLIASLAASLYGLPLVITFAGLGRANNRNTLSNIFLKTLVKVIFYFATHKRIKRFNITKNDNGLIILCQNPNDMSFVKKAIGTKSYKYVRHIYGSGVPNKYFDSQYAYTNQSTFPIVAAKASLSGFSCIYAARLLNSKGIFTFAELSNLIPQAKWHVYGEIDPGSTDSLNKNDLNDLKHNFPNLKMNGFVADPLINYKDESAVLIVPSLYGEGMPRAIAEAMTLGIPVICSKQAAADLFTDDMVYIVSEITPIAYKNALMELSHDNLSGKLFEKLTKAKDFARDNLLESANTEKMINVYSEFDMSNEQVYLQRDEYESISRMAN